MMIHMTNSHIIPYMVWNESNLDLEWHYGPQPAQQKYAHDMLRAEALGLQTGNLPLALAQVKDTKSKQEEALAYRSRFGAMIVHEIRVFLPVNEERALYNLLLDFGYGLPDAQVLNYWQEKAPVKTTNDAQVKWLLVKRNNELLLVLCTWNPEPESVEVKLDPVILGMTPAAASNEETKEAIPFADGKLTLKLDGYGVRMIRLK